MQNVQTPPRSRGIRLSAGLERQVALEAKAREKSFSAVTEELLEEAVRMRRAPGIVFADAPAGRRAVVAGSGLDVWEIAATWRRGGRDYARLRREYTWLTEPQLRAALGYYELYPTEIDARLAVEESWTPERLAAELPFSKPRRPSG